MFRLLTYNIQAGGGRRLEALAAVINGCAPDIVLLQEAVVPSHVARLAELTAMQDWRAVPGRSLAFLSRVPVATSAWVQPRVCRHAILDVVPAGSRPRLFGVHLSAVHAAWTERRRVHELRALLREVAMRADGPHVLAGDFNTVAPGDVLTPSTLPWRLRPLIWMSGGVIRWRTVQTVLDAGYIDAYRACHDDGGATLPAPAPHVRLDYVFLPAAERPRLHACDVVRDVPAPTASDHLPVLADLVE